ncbi:hypothetical protein [Salipiger mangrovisoli]|uniref:Outer membrane efflux protein n=1 Tax=Salipiger mangrovisoli TaxID=2865933 RepID=A0ABR9X666_9RHOB|nr:hypothetical protein [Salipiger mangrovisoli]MBE9638958.1 hypothetical protein [Salipiger mangrovisoli]
MQGYGTGLAEALASERGLQQSMALRADDVGILTALATRQGAILPGTPYAAIARAVLEGDAFRTESELRVARLRGEAEELDWLPDLAPVPSLTALRRMSEDAQALPERFDTPRKQAERDLALAEIDGAAVALAEGANAQVFEAISAHLVAEEARLRAGRQAALTAMARARTELATMGDSRLGGVEGLGTLRELVSPEPLTQMRARVAAAAHDAARLRAANVLLDGIDLSPSAEALAGFDGAGGELGEITAPVPLAWPEEVGETGELEIGTVAPARGLLAAAYREAESRRASTMAEAARAARQQRDGHLSAAQLLAHLLRAQEAQEAELAQRFACVRAELHLACLRGTLVAGTDL